ncbi:MAG TPA: hypothetical protein VFG10_02800 [Saprospiraceae bacterium]|nr:hypothetical protein [Saprospiraceae bacterium]
MYYGTLYHGIFTSDDSGMTFYENNAGLNYNGISIPDLVDDFVVMDPYIYAATTTGVLSYCFTVLLFYLLLWIV